MRALDSPTGAEVVAQIEAETGNVPDAFVAGVGTGGTLTGAGRRLKEANPNLHILTVIPERFSGIEGLKPLGQPGDIVPAILDEGLIDERTEVTSEEAAAMCARLTRLGLFVGPYSGAFAAGALPPRRHRPLPHHRHRPLRHRRALRLDRHVAAGGDVVTQSSRTGPRSIGRL